MRTHILPILFVYFPEALLTITITCALLGIKEQWKMVPVGLLLGIEMYAVGYFSGSYILVMMIHYCFVVGALWVLGVSGLYEIAICTSMTWSIVLMLEYICLSSWSLIVDLHPKVLIENPMLRIKVFAMQILLALLINLVLKYFKLSITD